MSDDGFNEHRRLILSGIEALQHNVESVAREQARANTATESAFAKLVTRTDAIDVWRSEHEKQRREDRTDVDKRLRELENTRSQALTIAALMSVVFGVAIALLSRVLVR